MRRVFEIKLVLTKNTRDWFNLLGDQIELPWPSQWGLLGFILWLHPSHANFWKWFGLISSSLKSLIVKWTPNSTHSKLLRCIFNWPSGEVWSLWSLERPPTDNCLFSCIFVLTLLSSGGWGELGFLTRCRTAPLAALHVHWTGREAGKVYSRVHSLPISRIKHHRRGLAETR